MSQETKREAEQVKEFFSEVTRKASESGKGIPDKDLHRKISKVEESAREVVKHIEERSK